MGLMLLFQDWDTALIKVDKTTHLRELQKQRGQRTDYVVVCVSPTPSPTYRDSSVSSDLSKCLMETMGPLPGKYLWAPLPQFLQMSPGVHGPQRVCIPWMKHPA